MSDVSGPLDVLFPSSDAHVYGPPGWDSFSLAPPSHAPQSLSNPGKYARIDAPDSFFGINASWIRDGNDAAANSWNARENVKTLGTSHERGQPYSDRSTVSERKHSCNSAVVEYLKPSWPKTIGASEARVSVDIPVHAAQDEAKVLYLHHLENVQQCPVPPWK